MEQSKKYLFTTEDGVDIFNGDSYFRVWNDSISSPPQLVVNAGSRFDTVNKLFSTFKSAEEYINKQQKQAVCAIIYNDLKQILLVSRKDNHNDFGLPGGKVDAGETLEEAIVREIKEETGVDVEVSIVLYSGMDEEGGNYFVTTFLCILKPNSKINITENLVVKWGSIDELLNPNSTFKYYNEQLILRLTRSMPRVDLLECKIDKTVTLNLNK